MDALKRGQDATCFYACLLHAVQHGTREGCLDEERVGGCLYTEFTFNQWTLISR